MTKRNGRQRREVVVAQRERGERLDRIREKLIERLDRSFLDGPVAAELAEYEAILVRANVPEDAAKSACLRLFQAFAAAFFPEEFMEPPELKGTYHGIVPRQPASIGWGCGNEDEIALLASLVKTNNLPALKPLRKYA